MSITLSVRTEPDGKLSLLDRAPVCLGCGVEVEVETYYTRTYRRASTGQEVKIRVGYHCRCGAVVIDGCFQGATLTFER